MIGGVVVLYNPTDEEIKNINSYKEFVKHVVIVDNSIVDNMERVNNIIALNENVTYYSEKTNMGLAKGFNIGVRLLIKFGCEWALLLDADSKLDLKLFEVYRTVLDKKDDFVAVYSPVHMFDRSKNKPYNGYKHVDWTMTSGCLYNCKIFTAQDGFFEDLFVDGLDMDYCFKSNENGYKVIECGSAILQHKPADTKSIFGIKYGIASPFRYYMQARQLIWNWKRYNKSKMLLIYLYKWFKVLVLFPQKKKYIGEMVRGTKDGKKLYSDWKGRI